LGHDRILIVCLIILLGGLARLAMSTVDAWSIADYAFLLVVAVYAAVRLIAMSRAASVTVTPFSPEG
jgi:hypothetical protein